MESIKYYIVLAGHGMATACGMSNIQEQQQDKKQERNAWDCATFLAYVG